MSTLTLFFTLFLAAPALPGVNMAGIDKNEGEALTALLQDAVCPCSPNETVLQCIQKKSCPPAVQLANFGADQFRQGLSIEQVMQAMVRRYIEKYVRYKFDLVSSPRKGAKNPKVTVVEFADFECPHCAEMSKILDGLVKKYPNDIAVVFKQFPLEHHVHASGAARAALAAGRQAKFWPMHDMIFMNQGSLSNEKFLQFARELGMNVERFKKDMNDAALYQQIDNERKEALQAQITGTPAVYVNGRMFMDGINGAKLEEMIQRVIKEER